jgi:hypothetical protein
VFTFKHAMFGSGGAIYYLTILGTLTIAGDDTIFEANR